MKERGWCDGNEDIGSDTGGVVYFAVGVDGLESGAEQGERVLGVLWPARCAAPARYGWIGGELADDGHLGVH